MSLAKRVWAGTAVGAPDECWPWQGYSPDGGYGRMEVSGNQVYAHRAAWEVTYGWHPCVRGRLGRPHVLHHCDNPPCCNPAHLFLGTQRSNVEDMREKGRGFDIPPKHGVDNRAHKLTPAQVAEIRERRQAGDPWLRIAKAFNVSRMTVQAIVNRKTWRDLS